MSQICLKTCDSHHKAHVSTSASQIYFKIFNNYMICYEINVWRQYQLLILLFIKFLKKMRSYTPLNILPWSHFVFDRTSVCICCILVLCTMKNINAVSLLFQKNLLDYFNLKDTIVVQFRYAESSFNNTSWLMQTLQGQCKMLLGMQGQGIDHSAHLGQVSVKNHLTHVGLVYTATQPMQGQCRRPLSSCRFSVRGHSAQEGLV